MPRHIHEDNREDQPLARRSQIILEHERSKQGSNPQNDLYQDRMNDDGQEIEDEITTEERRPIL